MKKKSLLLLNLICSIAALSQVGINTELPKTTLDVSVKMNGTTLDTTQIYGVQAPRLTRAELVTVSGTNTTTPKYGAEQKGALVYITDISGTDISGTSNQRKNILTDGYYLFDGVFWQKVNIEPWNNAVTTTQTDTNMAAMLNTQNIYQMGNVGIGVSNPARKLDIERTMRLSQTVGANLPNNILPTNSAGVLANTYRPIYANTTNGQVVYASDGFTRVIGGYRPGTGKKTIAKFNVNGGVYAKVRFVFYPSKSNANNHSNLSTYTSGEFIIVGTSNGTVGNLKMLNRNIIGYNGESKVLDSNAVAELRLASSTENEFSWVNNYGSAPGFGTTFVELDSTTGELSVTLGSTGGILSYYFEILGGD